MVTAVLAGLAFSGCGGDGITPSLVGQRLDVAESNVKDHGLKSEEIGGGTFGIVKKSNWTVCQQDPKPGAKDPDKVKLIVERVCSKTPADTAGASTTSPSDAASGASTDLLRGRLEGAGFTVREGEAGSGDPAPMQALATSLSPGDGTLYVYSSASDAARARKSFASLERSNPNQVRVEVVGAHLYVATIQEPARLSTARFTKFVDAGEGR